MLFLVYPTVRIFYFVLIAKLLFPLYIVFLYFLLIICFSIHYNTYIGDGSFLVSGMVVLLIFSGSIFF